MISLPQGKDPHLPKQERSWTRLSRIIDIAIPFRADIRCFKVHLYWIVTSPCNWSRQYRCKSNFHSHSWYNSEKVQIHSGGECFTENEIGIFSETNLAGQGRYNYFLVKSRSDLRGYSYNYTARTLRKLRPVYPGVKLLQFLLANHCRCSFLFKMLFFMNMKQQEIHLTMKTLKTLNIINSKMMCHTHLTLSCELSVR